MAPAEERRIVLLGKTGSGKSSLANTILGGMLFQNNHSSKSGTKRCQAETKEVNGRSITVIDTPGFFDTDSSEEEIKCEILRWITECADGPHAFLIVFKVEKFTEQEQAVIDKVCEYFSEEALKYASIVFTRGDDLNEGTKIEDFVAPNDMLSDLVKQCSGRCHVIDNKYWNNKEENDYRSNKFQVRQLLNSIDETVERNQGRCYTNEMLQEVEKKIQSEEERIRQSSPNMPEKEIRRQARDDVSATLEKELQTFSSKELLGAAFGVKSAVVAVAAVVAAAVVAAAVVAAGGPTAAVAAVALAVGKVAK